MANVSRNPREHWLKTHFLKNEVANSGYTKSANGIPHTADSIQHFTMQSE